MPKTRGQETSEASGNNDLSERSPALVRRCAANLALGLSLLGIAGCARQAPSAEGSVTPSSNFVSVIAVVPVKDHSAAMDWYRRWIGRDADVLPTEGVAEWQLAHGGWLQLAADPEHAGGTTVVVGIRDMDAQVASFSAAGLALGEVADLGFVKMAEATDPEGNKIVFVQEVR